MGFHAQLERSWAASSSMLCVGLDPDPARMPSPLDGTPDAIERFCRAIVDATADLVCAFKPQIAYFASQREEAALERICSYIRETYPDVTLILDAKRGDIGSTAEHYAREAFGRYGAHAVTVNPYLGTDSVEPFFQHTGNGGGGVIALCRTSNPGGDDFQSLVTADENGHKPIYLHVAERVANEWSQLGDCGLVVGATYPEELAEVRAVAPGIPFLVPGVGAQGGDAATVVQHGSNAARNGLMVSSSRAVLYASSGDDFAEAARAEAQRTAASLAISPV
ncbi:orotidine-5'-phosphate decarboxylase [uncultured Ilumatobacter sp.]|uniref:orotidine-5'-phosphate decarboxylase n=1 Tax=uncultured Ilumatobacter sp. TaxID=879968 RepID=UPI00374EDAA7